jgi:hypothetical protein
MYGFPKKEKKKEYLYFIKSSLTFFINVGLRMHGQRWILVEQVTFKKNNLVNSYAY